MNADDDVAGALGFGAALDDFIRDLSSALPVTISISCSIMPKLGMTNSENPCRTRKW
jgi:hypothetical protein